MNMGYDYLTPSEAKQKRGNRLGDVILTDILREWLHKNNAIEYRGKVVPFSDKNIQYAIDELANLNLGTGIMPENERIYDLITNIKSLEQTIDHNKRGHSPKYIDWQQPENNVYRILIEMLAVTLSKNARARAVQLPAWNEALGLPRPWDQQWSLRMQQIMAYETDLLEFGELF